MQKQNKYVLILIVLANVSSCVHEISANSAEYFGKNEFLAIERDEKTLNAGCNLIWSIRNEKQKEIYFHNTCINQTCMVTWQSMNFLGIWSSFHYDHIPPQGELSYPVSVFDVHFKVDYYFK